MSWASARIRVGETLIGERASLLERWHTLLHATGRIAHGLEGCAADLLIQSAAALADGDPADAPLRRCSGLLRLDGRAPDGPEREAALLFELLEEAAVRACYSREEEDAARAILRDQALQTREGLRATAARLFGGGAPAGAPEFGGVIAVSWLPEPAAELVGCAERTDPTIDLAALPGAAAPTPRPAANG